MSDATRLTRSGAKAFGKGPGPRRARFRGDSAPYPWFARDGMDVGHLGDLIPTTRAPHGRLHGRTGLRAARSRILQRVIPTGPKPHERDRMKHAGRLRRGANRQGREKRRRRNEASLGTRDEGSRPIGTCSPTGLLGGRQGADSRLPATYATDLGPERAPQEAGWVPQRTGRSPANGPSRIGPPSITAIDSSVVGQWRATRSIEASGQRGATFGRQAGRARKPPARTDSGRDSGK